MTFCSSVRLRIWQHWCELQFQFPIVKSYTNHSTVHLQWWYLPFQLRLFIGLIRITVARLSSNLPTLSEESSSFFSHFIPVCKIIVFFFPIILGSKTGFITKRFGGESEKMTIYFSSTPFHTNYPSCFWVPLGVGSAAFPVSTVSQCAWSKSEKDYARLRWYKANSLCNEPFKHRFVSFCYVSANTCSKKTFSEGKCF